MAAWAAALLLATALPAWAGRNCEAAAPDAGKVQLGLDLAVRTAQALDATGARVVLLARAGQDLSRYHLRWSHVGWAYRQGDQPWRVVHKLNQCGADSADLYRQGLGEFLLDDPHEYRVGLVVPTPEVQARLLAVLPHNETVARLHVPAYSVVAYPWARRYQQSNQWAIETLAMALEPVADTRERAQAWLRLQGYRPAVLHIGALERLGARVSRANVAFDDHPLDQRAGGRIHTVSADSVFDWLARTGMAGAVQEVR